MYQGQKRPATRGKSASTSIVVTANTPPGPQRRVHGAQRARGVGQVLDDVPHRDDVVGALGQRRVLDDADVHGPAHARLGPLGGPARRLDARDLEAGALGQLDERPDVAADVQQAAGGREAAHVVEALGERRDAALLLLDVAHVLDVAVGVLHREVVRPRVHVDDPARAALDDAAEAPELARGRRVVALRVDGLGQRRVVAHAIAVGIAQRAAHGDLAAAGVLASALAGAGQRVWGSLRHGRAFYERSPLRRAAIARRGDRRIASRVGSCASRSIPANAPRGGRSPRRRSLRSSSTSRS